MLNARLVSAVRVAPIPEVPLFYTTERLLTDAACTGAWKLIPAVTKSTYCLGVAPKALVGLPLSIRGPVIVLPASSTALVTALAAEVALVAAAVAEAAADVAEVAALVALV